jgi:hypothetical protein
MFETDHIKLIEPYEVVGGCISIYRNIWENPEETIAQIEEYNSKPGITCGFRNAVGIDRKPISARTNMDFGLTYAAEEDDVMKELNKRFFELTWATAIGYNKHFGLEEATYFTEGFNVLRYQTGEEYKAHYDGGSGGARSISPILYLNDEYEGGEIEFVNFGITIKPEPGMLILFPSTYPYKHIAHPVKSGTKYAIVTWLHDRPYDPLIAATLGH